MIVPQLQFSRIQRCVASLHLQLHNLLQANEESSSKWRKRKDFSVSQVNYISNSISYKLSWIAVWQTAKKSTATNFSTTSPERGRIGLWICKSSQLAFHRQFLIHSIIVGQSRQISQRQRERLSNCKYWTEHCGRRRGGWGGGGNKKWIQWTFFVLRCDFFEKGNSNQSGQTLSATFIAKNIRKSQFCQE